MLRLTLFALCVDGAVAQALRGTQAAKIQTAPMSNGTFLTPPPPLEHCRRLSQLYHAHGCAASSTTGRCDYCKDDAQGLGICVETEAFSEICTSGSENSDCKTWLWGTETAQKAFFYLRGGPKGSVYTFIPNETSTVDLLEIAHENSAGQEEATGLKSLYQNLPENETVKITLFWWNSSLFDGKVLNKNDRLVCTKRNVLRIAFGVQGGLEAARHQCDREPELSLEQKNEWTISRYSRTDIDEQVVKIICEAGHQGYYSDNFETPEGEVIWKDHEENPT